MSREARPLPDLPAPVDPVPPRAIPRYAAGAVYVGGMFAYVISMVVSGGESDLGKAPVIAQAFAVLWMVSLPLAFWIIAARTNASRRRQAGYERRAGFLPREGREDLPATGRTTLYRLEYGDHGDQVCLMVARWTYSKAWGWRRDEAPAEHAWVAVDDPVVLGAERARLTDVAERLEEEADTARLEEESQRELRAFEFNERLARRREARRLAKELARDPH